MKVNSDLKDEPTKRCRTRFNIWQIQRLEQVFGETHYPDAQQMHRLGQDTSIPTPKMQIWFQNRRAKWRKNSRLKNFGGLATVKETKYVPAPHMTDTLQPLNSYDVNNFQHNNIQIKSEENNAIDLRIRSPESNGSTNVSSPEMSEPMFDSNVYKKFAGITRVRLNDSDLNAFEYPAALHYSRHYMDNRYGDHNRQTQPVMPFIFASNQKLTSLLFAPHIYSRLHTIGK